MTIEGLAARRVANAVLCLSRYASELIGPWVRRNPADGLRNPKVHPLLGFVPSFLNRRTSGIRRNSPEVSIRDGAAKHS